MNRSNNIVNTLRSENKQCILHTTPKYFGICGTRRAGGMYNYLLTGIRYFPVITDISVIIKEAFDKKCFFGNYTYHWKKVKTVALFWYYNAYGILFFLKKKFIYLFIQQNVSNVNIVSMIIKVTINT